MLFQSGCAVCVVAILMDLSAPTVLCAQQTDAQTPHVATQAALAATTIAKYPEGVWRDDYSTGLGASPQFYLPESGACTSNNRVNDGGSCINESSGNSFYTTFSAVGGDIREWGGDTTGANNSLTALNACTAAALNCLIPPGATIRAVGGTPNIPGAHALMCAETITSRPLGESALPSIRIDTAHPITYTGANAALINCRVFPDGMTFPQSGSTSWTGTAINMNGQTGATLENVAIAGFDVCLTTGTILGEKISGRIIEDCNGGHNAGTASMVVSNGGDIGIISNVELQPLATGTACPDRERFGKGILFTSDRGNWIDNLIVQDYTIGDIEFLNSGAEQIGKLWADYARFAGCPLNTKPFGVLFNNSSAIYIQHLDLNTMQVGMVVCNSVREATIHIDDIFGNGTGGDLIQLGQSAKGGYHACGNTGNYEHAGTVSIGSLRTQQSSMTPNIGGFAINYLDPTSGNTKLVLNAANLFGVKDRVAAYINIPSTAFAFKDIQINWPLISTDLGANQAVAGTPSVSCSNVTSCTLAGTFVTRLNANPFQGIVQLTGDGSHNNGIITVKFPLSMDTASCTANYQNGNNGSWGSGLVPIVSAVTGSATATLAWGQTSALTRADHYDVSYSCVPQ